MATVSHRNRANDEVIEELNELLRGEMAAVDTYRIALEKLEMGAAIREPMDACLRSHASRVTILQQRIRALGGTPAETAGTWGTIARAAETVSADLGAGPAIAALERGENHGLTCYRVEAEKLSPEALDVLTRELLPRQTESHRVMKRLHRFQKATVSLAESAKPLRGPRRHPRTAGPT